MIPFLIDAYIVILGLCIGSFLNVCILRYHQPKNVQSKRSHCPKCQTTLTFKDLIPLFSWLCLGGKCRYCKGKISIQYPLVEALSSVLFLLCFKVFGFTLLTPIYWVFISTLLYVALVDYREMIIPDRSHVILFILGCILMFGGYNAIESSLGGMLIISLPLFILAYLTKGIGYGDVKLMASAGLVLGFSNIILAFFIGIISGGLFGAILLARKLKESKAEMPLGPWLILGIGIALFFGQPIINWYLSLLA